MATARSRHKSKGKTENADSYIGCVQGDIKFMEAIWDWALRIGSLLGFVGAGYAVYETFLERAKVDLYPADSISFVVSRQGYISKFHLGCSFANKTSKPGTVHLLEVEVINPKNEVRRFRWKLFYEYQPETGQILKKSDPYPITVMPKSSQMLSIEFEATNSIPSEEWILGHYELNVIGWVNKKGRASKSNLTSRFHINITEEIHEKLMNEQKLGPARDGGGGLALYGPSVCLIPVEEWYLTQSHN